jgi:hypothetical protein
MSKDAVTMNNEIRVIARYRALIISRYFITLLLLIMSLYLGFIRYALSPFYILLALNVIPTILNMNEINIVELKVSGLRYHI